MDFVKWCAEQGLGGLVLLAVIGMAALLALLALLTGLLHLLGFTRDLGDAFRKGWRESRE